MARYSVEFDDFAECNMHAQAPEFAALISKIFATAKQQIDHGDASRDRAALLLIQDMADIFGDE